MRDNIKEFEDMVLPSGIKFYVDYFILGDTYRSIWAIKEYPYETTDTTLFSKICQKENVMLHMYCRTVDSFEEKKIISHATRKNTFNLQSFDMQTAIDAKDNIDDVKNLISEIRKDKVKLCHLAVFIEMASKTKEELDKIRDEVSLELYREKIVVDKLYLSQKEAFIYSRLSGNGFVNTYFERIIPSSSVANLYPFCYSGKSDSSGFYIGKDRYGSSIIVDLNKKDSDKTNSNVLILGNSGIGKSYLAKLLTINLRESGKKILILDPEEEYLSLTDNLGGTYLDLMKGEYIINPLEIRNIDDEGNTFYSHIGFLKNFFKIYKEFSREALDTLEIILINLYDDFNITPKTDLASLKKEVYPTFKDLYFLIEDMLKNYKDNQYIKKEALEELSLGLNSICVGSESIYFASKTNILNDDVITFGLKGILNQSSNIKNVMLFNVFTYMNNLLLNRGNSVALIDELYLFLESNISIEYIRNALKRVRKKDSSIILSSQNIEDFLISGIKEYTKPLFSIPSHQFLFFPGNISKREYIDVLRLEESEFDIISTPERGNCLYRCGSERYNLDVIASEYKAKLFS